MQCPDCKRNLILQEDTNHTIFQCQFCGFQQKIFAENKAEAYTKMINQITISRKKKYELPEEEKKEDLLIIRKTDKEIAHIIKNGGNTPKRLPNVIQRIIKNPDVELVYYRYLQKHTPAPNKETLDFPPPLKKGLKKKNISNLFDFQAKSYKSIREGNSIVIVAPTGTGKTEAFLFPILSEIWDVHPNPIMRHGPFAIFIYPTKALARDQNNKINQYSKELNISCEVYDGDTPLENRKKIFEYPPDILITNPDMLHIHMQRGDFRNLIRQVKFVVIDEIHVCTGAFGSNLYFILKRLQRITKNKTQYIGASATIGNAVDFTNQLFDHSVKSIELKDARKASTHLLLLYPYSASQYTVTGELAKQLIISNHKTLIFQNSHKDAEITNLQVKRLNIKTAVHRAGLTQKYRNTVEQKFIEGLLDVLVSTPTLELGIDIGDVDAVISAVVDFTRFTQRLGRAGRKGQESVGILLLRNNDPISTYYSFFPETYFDDVRQGYVEPNNEIVSYYQLLATAFDSPIQKNEFVNHAKALKRLVDDGYLKETTSGSYRVKDRRKAYKALGSYNIRGIGDALTILTTKNKIVGKRSMPMAARELHPGAIYLLGGNHYRVLSFNYNPVIERGDVKVQEIAPLYKKTTAQRYAMPEILAINDKKRVLGTEIIYCDLQITEIVTGYTESNIFTNEDSQIISLETPIEYSYKTKGFMFTLPKPIKIISDHPGIKEELLLGGSFHAVEHVLIESSGMLTGGGSTELGGISMGTSGAIFVYDGSKGGSGLSKLLYDRIEEALKRSKNILENCSCDTLDGCPKCTFSYQCGNNNSPLAKQGAIESLQLLNESDLQIIDDFDEYDSYV